MNIGIFFGSSSGVTRGVAQKLAQHLEDAQLIDMEEDYDDVDQLLEYDVLLIGSSTWGQGDPQRDWVDPLYAMDNDRPDFGGKKVAFFGAGDQAKHGEHFVSALGKMYDLFTALGAEGGYGFTETSGYDYAFSLAVREGKFCGLAIDDLNQKDLSDNRIKNWADQIKSEMGI